MEQAPTATIYSPTLAFCVIDSWSFAFGVGLHGLKDIFDALRPRVVPIFGLASFDPDEAERGIIFSIGKPDLPGFRPQPLDQCLIARDVSVAIHRCELRATLKRYGDCGIRADFGDLWRLQAGREIHVGSGPKLGDCHRPRMQPVTNIAVSPSVRRTDAALFRSSMLWREAPGFSCFHVTWAGGASSAACSHGRSTLIAL